MGTVSECEGINEPLLRAPGSWTHSQGGIYLGQGLLQIFVYWFAPHPFLSGNQIQKVEMLE